MYNINDPKTCYDKLCAHWRERNPIKGEITKGADMCLSCRNPLVQEFGWDSTLCERVDQ